MSGNRRRSSGEIINATLLEVFLALSFVVFALAVFEQRRAQGFEDALRNRPSDAQVGAVRESLDAARRVAGAHADSTRQARRDVAAAERTIDSLRFLSPYPPDCEPHAVPAEVLTVILSGTDKLRVVARRSAFGLAAGEVVEATGAGFVVRFSAARAYSIEHGCRYLVRIEDTPEMPKAGYKAALASVTSIFRFRGAFR